MTDDVAQQKPILFSTPMVAAILAGTKTQTRRLVKPPRRKVAQWLGDDRWYVDPGGGIALPYFGPGPYVKMVWVHKGDLELLPGNPAITDLERMERVRCPYGYPEYGDTLWVREAFHTDERDMEAARAQHEDFMSPSPIHYRTEERDNPHAGWRWRPSIHMPRWACRLVLKVTRVRAERLQDIGKAHSDKDNLVTQLDAEGFRSLPGCGWLAPGMGGCFNTGIEAWIASWDSIYGKHAPWSRSPYVWVIDFEVVP